MKRITIRQSKDNVKDVVDILKVFEVTNKQLHFSLMFIDGTYKRNASEKHFGLESKINLTLAGLILNFHEIIKFFEGVEQIFDVLILVDENASKFSRELIKEDFEMYANYYATISFFDAGFWEISCDQNLVIQMLQTIQTRNSNIG